MRVAPRGSPVAGLALRVNRGETGACRCYRPARMGSEDLAACAATGGMVYGGGGYLKGGKWWRKGPRTRQHQRGAVCASLTILPSSIVTIRFARWAKAASC